MLNVLARGCINLSRIEAHWDEIMRVADSLKTGAISASFLSRSLVRSSRPSGLAQVVIEAGRVNRTLYLLSLY